ncbi:phage holin family protein [Xanthobacter sp. V3C-3]|uniref:phage holin family protein n=1 Tax=Xanthobacter lutulentifluminis TaxID=3119935 RepID=UPI003729B5C8
MNLDQLSRHLRILLRTNTIIAEIHLRHMVSRAGLFAFAALVASFGVVMLGVALFLALEETMGAKWAAVVVGAGGLALGLIVAVIGARLKPSRELDLANQVNQSALDAVQADLRATGASFSQFASLAAVPSLVTPVLTLLLRLVRGRPRQG